MMRFDTIPAAWKQTPLPLNPWRWLWVLFNAAVGLLLTGMWFMGRCTGRCGRRWAVVAQGLLTIVGAGGAGKTHLAIQVVTDLAQRFNEGTAFVSLASVPTLCGCRRGWVHPQLALGPSSGTFIGCDGECWSAMASPVSPRFPTVLRALSSLPSRKGLVVSQPALLIIVIEPSRVLE